MLAEIAIRNVAIIDEVQLGFAPGLNIVTGETGSGKSILIDSLGLLLGARASSELIRSGCEEALVEARFVPPFDPLLPARFAQLDLPWHDDRIIVHRLLARNGRNRITVNDRQVPLTALAEIAPALAEICGQHAYQTLLRGEDQRALLDDFGRLDKPLRACADTWRAWREAAQNLKRLEDLEHRRTEREQLLRFQLDEIEEVDPAPGEEEPLKVERSRLRNVERLQSDSAESLLILHDQDPGVQAELERVRRLVHDMALLDGTLASPREMIEQAGTLVAEAVHELRVYQERLDADPQRLEDIEQRLQVLNGLKKKYGGTVEAVVAHAQKARHELEEIGDYAASLEAARESCSRMRRACLHAAKTLSQARREAAAELESAMAHRLAELAMPNARFAVRFQSLEDRPERWSAAGIDEIEMHFSANLGEPPKPLSRIASGGELSRILLALRRASLDRAAVRPAAVFDEVDSGIGGEVAEVVGRMLAEIARDGQVLVVTHLPQIAVCASRHLRVGKTEREGRTVTHVDELGKREREAEIARMLAGAEVTDLARKHARQLLAQYAANE